MYTQTYTHTQIQNACVCCIYVCVCVCVYLHFKILERVSSSGFTPTFLFIISFFKFFVLFFFTLQYCIVLIQYNIIQYCIISNWNTLFLIETQKVLQQEEPANLLTCKAFDCVDHNKLWKILKEMGKPDHLTCLLRNLYAGQEAKVRTGHGTKDWFQIEKGVRQGYILSPCLFNLYAEYIMRNAGLEEA